MTPIRDVGAVRPRYVGAILNSSSESAPMQTIESVGQGQPVPRLPGMDAATGTASTPPGSRGERPAARPPDPAGSERAMARDRQRPPKPVNYGAGF